VMYISSNFGNRQPASAQVCAGTNNTTIAFYSYNNLPLFHQSKPHNPYLHCQSLYTPSSTRGWLVECTVGAQCELHRSDAHPSRIYQDLIHNLTAIGRPRCRITDIGVDIHAQ
jgi:hypothetical protein